ncbi:hypothetical protein SAMN06265337_1585 [Hymenobacter gelipurpurascens]|uniref:Uncharacterized protein n=1 Tax=Hymenobacter gelipurpurascens TaxID=89968 RepID=A0A212TKI9_9BACT|nr:hypothetical protein [Hymenobacter gelipurpurascens]SNC66361.1 hypothetical protein SAMN06265337_1585 [Hymenobacter gelipurpurascens]
MKQSAFLPRLGAYFVGLPVLLVIYLFSRSIITMQVMMPLFAAALFAAIWGQAKIRKSYPQDFKLREEWMAFGIFVVVVIGAAIIMLR